MRARSSLCLLLALALSSCSPGRRDDFEIGFESKGCGEGTPVLYRFTIHRDGRVEYFGQHAVKVLGPAEGRIEAGKARALWLEAERLRVLDLQEHYWPEGWSDYAGVALSFREGGRRNSIDFLWFDAADDMKPSTQVEQMCAQLSDFGRELESAVDVTRWIGTPEEVFANHFWRDRDR